MPLGGWQEGEEAVLANASVSIECPLSGMRTGSLLKQAVPGSPNIMPPGHCQSSWIYRVPDLRGGTQEGPNQRASRPALVLFIVWWAGAT